MKNNKIKKRLKQENGLGAAFYVAADDNGKDVVVG